MFVAITTYRRVFMLDDPVIVEHWAYQDQAYLDGKMVASGPQDPAVGGVLVLRGSDEIAVRDLLDADPIFRDGLATYELVRFRSTRGAHPDLIEAR